MPVPPTVRFPTLIMKIGSLREEKMPFWYAEQRKMIRRLYKKEMHAKGKNKNFFTNVSLEEKTNLSIFFWNSLVDNNLSFQIPP